MKRNRNILKRGQELMLLVAAVILLFPIIVVCGMAYEAKQDAIKHPERYAPRSTLTLEMKDGKTKKVGNVLEYKYDKDGVMRIKTLTGVQEYKKGEVTGVTEKPIERKPIKFIERKKRNKKPDKK